VEENVLVDERVKAKVDPAAKVFAPIINLTTDKPAGSLAATGLKDEATISIEVSFNEYTKVPAAFKVIEPTITI
jgi:hypothetical protein